MFLPWNERLTMVAVPSAPARRRGDLGRARGREAPPDVDANRGVFAPSPASPGQVEAFEPNPDYTRFAQRMLRGCTPWPCPTRPDVPSWSLPVSEEGVVLHLGGTLKQHAAASCPGAVRFQVEVRTLDSYAFKDVQVVKVDVEEIGCSTAAEAPTFAAAFRFLRHAIRAITPRTDAQRHMVPLPKVAGDCTLLLWCRQWAIKYYRRHPCCCVLEMDVTLVEGSVAAATQRQAALAERKRYDRSRQSSL